MHEFVAKENSCFFDICLPNYTPDCHSRRITYFKEVLDADACAAQVPSISSGITELEYYTTPPEMPTNFSLVDLDYRGELQ